jgi:2-polyprenyl-6-methoxyphenol hydroxylase-like FAD-dependent oxidoreductase
MLTWSLSEEKALRREVNRSNLCDFRTGVNVSKIKQMGETGVEIHYTTADGSEDSVRSRWLIGADGKKGVVRKDFLEPIAGVKQVYSDYRYEGTWIAANLRITLPTPETHPDFPPWATGMTPEDVYDLYWPKGWHFCSPPGKPVACGRFGPHESGFWRHEFEERYANDKVIDAEKLLWENLMPMITQSGDNKGHRFGKDVVYPRDCIKVLRCRPFTFTHKVVNRWFYKRTILIGDAAHVFPPFGGQGIASGIRDAHQLAWRIALLEAQPNADDTFCNRVLDLWATERVQSVNVAANFTKMNGMLCNSRLPIAFWALKFTETATRLVYPGSGPYDPQRVAERKGLSGLEGGFYLREHRGGTRIPQMYTDTIGRRQILSDLMFEHAQSPLKLVVLMEGTAAPEMGRKSIEDLLRITMVPGTVLSPDSVAFLSLTATQPEAIGPFAWSTTSKFVPSHAQHLPTSKTKFAQNVTEYSCRFGRETRFIILRPDFYVFATARDLQDLRCCMEKLCRLIKTPKNVV